MKFRVTSRIKILVGSCKGMKGTIVEKTSNDTYYHWWVKVDCDKPGFRSYRAYKESELKSINKELN
jgi:hypothetical protein